MLFRSTDTTLVVVSPGWGDAVQVAKAGILEIADIFVVNKCDRDGAAETVRDLEMMLDLSGHPEWRAPIVQTVATTGRGVDEFWAAIGDHRAFMLEQDRLAGRRDQRTREELRKIVLARLIDSADAACAGPAFEALVHEVAERRTDPYTAAATLLGR